MITVSNDHEASSSSNMSENVIPKNINFGFIQQCYNTDLKHEKALPTKRMTDKLKLIEPLKSAP
jgi:hypothetical protein